VLKHAVECVSVARCNLEHKRSCIVLYRTCEMNLLTETREGDAQVHSISDASFRCKAAGRNVSTSGQWKIRIEVHNHRMKPEMELFSVM
jgi:hypothetical protein